VFSILVECTAAEEDFLTAALWEAGTLGIVEEPGALRAFFDQATSVDSITAALRRPAHSIRLEPEADWEEITRASFPPLLIGERFFLVPPWSTEPAPNARIRLEVNPGMACGTGWHPCTQMCLAALERTLRPGDRVLDVGSGSGILSQAAALLGAGFVIGCDVDPEVSPGFIGSINAVRTRSMDLIVANISAPVVEDLVPEFHRVLKPESTLIISGFTESEIPAGFQTRETIRSDEWVSLIVGS
jgi:ribosomal protein L11 methyltransferase